MWAYDTVVGNDLYNAVLASDLTIPHTNYFLPYAILISLREFKQ